jgi:hypothetical protein
VIKSLGKEFCKMPNSMLTNETLQHKPHTRTPAGPRVKQNNKAKGKSKDEDKDGHRKKN